MNHPPLFKTLAFTLALVAAAPLAAFAQTAPLPPVPTVTGSNAATPAASSDISGNAVEISDAAGTEVAGSPAFKTFLAGYIAAVNAKSSKKLKAYLDPTCAALMVKNKELDHYFKANFSGPIPAKHEIALTAIPANAELPFVSAGAVYPVRPTFLLNINATTSTGDDSSIVTILITMEGGKWFEVFPSTVNTHIGPAKDAADPAKDAAAPAKDAAHP